MTLIGTKALPGGLAAMREMAREARAYHDLEPYPVYNFRPNEWKVEDRGPLPRCVPFVRSIVRRGARWLFGRTPSLTVPGDAQFEEFVNGAMKAGRMSSRLVAMAEDAAIEGGVVLKFAYDEKRPGHPLSIQSLSPISQAHLYYHPHDADRLLMARVQYCYTDGATGKSLWHREEWTDEELVRYEPLEAKKSGEDPNLLDGWRIAGRDKNPFKTIPMVLVKNLESGGVWGRGDAWSLYRVIDRINLCWHLMDMSNQYDSRQNPWLIDAEVRDEGPVQTLAPGEPIEVESVGGENGADYKGSVSWPPSGNSLRPAMMEYACKLQKMVTLAASSVEVDQSEFSNKGNLTNAVLAQLYLPQIEITEEKRKTWGEYGLGAFFEKVALGLANAGIATFKDPVVEFKWRDYFEMSENEKAARLGRVQEAVVAGFLTKERAIEAYADIEGIEDAAALKEDLANEPRPSPNVSDPSYGPPLRSITQAARLKAIGGAESA